RIPVCKSSVGAMLRCRNGLNPTGCFLFKPAKREYSGECESADLPNMPAQTRGVFLPFLVPACPGWKGRVKQ
ncbi:MAG: hypothetical protein ACKVP5_10135, partial [Aestuariivirga sp.]